jgi:hypothetical protein
VKKVAFFAQWVLILAFGGGWVWAGSEEVLEKVGNGVINWSKGIILAKGSGAPPKEARNIAQARLMTERAALSDARRNLLEVLKGVRVDSTTLVENFMAKNDQVRLQAEGFIQGSVEVRRFRRYLSDGAIEITVAVDLAGDFLSLLLTAAEEPKKEPPKLPVFPVEPKPEKKALPPTPLPQVKEARPTLPPPAPVTAPEKKAEPPPPPAAPLPQVKEARSALPPPAPVTTPEKKPEPADLPSFTGAVIDTRGLKLKPALMIRLLDESGQELYRGQYVPQEKAMQSGLALFSRDLTAAQTNPRVGRNPLTVKGFKVNPTNPTDIILAKEEAKKLAPFAQKGTFLEDCRVMIVLD